MQLHKFKHSTKHFINKFKSVLMHSMQKSGIQNTAHAIISKPSWATVHKYHGKTSPNIVVTVVAKYHHAKSQFSGSKQRKTTKLSRISINTCSHHCIHWKSIKVQKTSHPHMLSYQIAANLPNKDRSAKRGHQIHAKDHQTVPAR